MYVGEFNLMRLINAYMEHMEEYVRIYLYKCDMDVLQEWRILCPGGYIDNDVR